MKHLIAVSYTHLFNEKLEKLPSCKEFGDVGRGKYITDVLRFRLSLFSVRGLDEELALLYGDLFVLSLIHI